jgi:hypothetical protein
MKMRRKQEKNADRRPFIWPFGLLNARVGFNLGNLGLGHASALVRAAPQAHLAVGSI